MFKDAEVPSNNAVAAEPAVVFASLGFIVIAPDYVGYGASKGARHPYLLSAPSASAVVDLLTAAKTWRARNNVADNGQLFLIGYSEGGYVTVAAHRALQAANSPQVANLSAVVPGAGPYHVGVTLDALLSRVQDEVPVLGALITPKLLRFLGGAIRNQLRDELLKRLIPADADVVFDTTIIDHYLADDDAAIERQSNVHDWAPIAPVRFFHGRDDQTVPYVVATQTLQTMIARGARDVSLTDCAAVPASHLGCVPRYIGFMLGQLAPRVRDL
jgi:pimeloyl-ACP methyl ester carboxylesterase